MPPTPNRHSMSQHDGRLPWLEPGHLVPRWDARFAAHISTSRDVGSSPISPWSDVRFAILPMRDGERKEGNLAENPFSPGLTAVYCDLSRYRICRGDRDPERSSGKSATTGKIEAGSFSKDNPSGPSDSGSRKYPDHVAQDEHEEGASNCSYGIVRESSLGRAVSKLLYGLRYQYHLDKQSKSACHKRCQLHQD